ncbi:reverse transcriptase [Senna tora]|uniref:Reverse transcriptase n=1 Tax=Senna tora TaxID=362788 RepID=A0A834SXW9_9FABA|nr:reverse transcriptase [Senna tora]
MKASRALLLAGTSSILASRIFCKSSSTTPGSLFFGAITSLGTSMNSTTPFETLGFSLIDQYTQNQNRRKTRRSKKVLNVWRTKKNASCGNNGTIKKQKFQMVKSWSWSEEEDDNLLDEENLIHILRDCQVSSNVWSSLKVSSSFYQTPIQSWLKLNAKDSSTSSFNIPWNTIFTYTVRGIWLTRNENFFKGKALNPAVLVNQILQKAAEYSHLSSHCRPAPATHTIQVSWTKPQPPFLKLNVDGSCAEKQLGSSGIIRDDKGNHVLSFSHFTGSGNIFIAELWALQIGIQLAVKQRVNYLEIESNSLTPVISFLWLTIAGTSWLPSNSGKSDTATGKPTLALML